MENTITKQEEITNALNKHYGSESFSYASPFNRNFVMTEGITHMTELCKCFWLIDIVTIANLKDDFQKWIIVKKDDDSAVVTCEDGNSGELYRQEIPFTDFPLDMYSFYCELGSIDGINPKFVIMLSGER
jgi:hypothetical protein